MMCQACKKQAATVHLTEVVNSERRERHLCEPCAAKEGVTGKIPEPINELVAKFVLAQGNTQELAQLTCAECGMTFLQFRNSGLLGCPNDYNVFDEPLSGLLERAHGGQTRHVGKVPGDKENKHKRQHELMRIKPELQQAIEAEDYKRASRLHERIKELEEQ